ncbi:MAG: hypothetical protein AB1758_36410, partial [Candidatus Eremiobacterota bacterium]
VDTTSSYTGTKKVLPAAKPVASFTSPIPKSLATMDISTAALTPPPPPPSKSKGKSGSPPPPPGPPVLTPGAYRNVTVESGKTLQLKSGRYYVSEKFLVDGGTVEVDSSMGPVILYVGQEMTILNSGRVNPYDQARDLQVYFTDEQVTLDPATGLPANDPVTGLPMIKSQLNVTKGTATMVAAGKRLEVTGDEFEMYGAVVGGLIKLTKSKLHYDTSLKDQALGGQATWTLEGVHEFHP